MTTLPSKQQELQQIECKKMDKLFTSHFNILAVLILKHYNCNDKSDYSKAFINFIFQNTSMSYHIMSNFSCDTFKSFDTLCVIDN